MNAKPRDLGEEIASLLTLAAWYRSWAKLTDSAGERAGRLAMAEGVERRIKQLREAPEPPEHAS
jgi:hypothetical protein